MVCQADGKLPENQHPSRGKLGSRKVFWLSLYAYYLAAPVVTALAASHVRQLGGAAPRAMGSMYGLELVGG